MRCFHNIIKLNKMSEEHKQNEDAGQNGNLTPRHNQQVNQNPDVENQEGDSQQGNQMDEQFDRNRPQPQQENEQEAEQEENNEQNEMQEEEIQKEGDDNPPDEEHKENVSNNQNQQNQDNQQIQQNQQNEAIQQNPQAQQQKEKEQQSKKDKSNKGEKENSKIKQIKSLKEKNIVSYASRLEKILDQKESAILDMLSEAMMRINELKELKRHQKQLQEKLKEKQAIASDYQQKTKEVQRRLKVSENSVEKLQNQLVSYREVGDIQSLLKKVERLEVLVQSQEEEITLANSKIDIMEENPMEKVTKEQLEKIETLYNQNQDLKKTVDHYSRELERQKSENQQANTLVEKLDVTIKEKMTEIDKIKEQELEDYRKLRQMKENYQGKIQKLEHSLSAAHDVGDGKEHRTERDLEKQLSDEKQAFYLQYKTLEMDYQTLQETNHELKQKVHSMRSEIKANMNNKVSKKDYDEIVHKYKKAKECLERVIQENKQLRDNAMDQFCDNKEGFKKSMEIIENFEEHDNIQEYMKVFGEHVKQSLQYFKNSNEIMDSIHIERYKQQIKDLTRKNIENQEQIERMERMNTVLERELAFKNNILEDLVKESKYLREKNDELTVKKRQTQWELLDCANARTQIKTLELGSLGLITKNKKLISEVNQWKYLYLNLKKQYETFLKGQSYRQSEEQKQNDDQNVIQIEPTDKQNNETNKDKPPVITKESECQTEGVERYDLFHYKELKKILTIFKKFPEEVKKLLEGLELKKTELEEAKKKYDTMITSYNKKFQDLQIEKGKNDSYLAKRKEEIITDFQDIRQLIENDRLLGSLRKAKNLIEALEKDECEMQAEQ